MPPVDPQKIGDRLRADGWKTGSVLCPNLTQQVALQRSSQPPRILAADERLIVVSQTCDVVARKLDQEPYVEVLVARQRAAIDTTKAALRSTRHLSFRSKLGGAVFEAHATDRFWIPRELFHGFVPDAERSLDERASRRVCDWLGLRYTRRAWPNALVDRLPKLEEMEKIFRDVELAMAEIRVAIVDVDKELPPEKPYHLTVYAVMDAEVFETDPARRESCTKAFFTLLDRLRECPGVLVSEDSEFLPGNEFNWELMQLTDEWNLANLTAQAEDR